MTAWECRAAYKERRRPAPDQVPLFTSLHDILSIYVMAESPSPERQSGKQLHETPGDGDGFGTSKMGNKNQENNKSDAEVW